MKDHRGDVVLNECVIGVTWNDVDQQRVVDNDLCSLVVYNGVRVLVFDPYFDYLVTFFDSVGSSLLDNFIKKVRHLPLGKFIKKV